MKTYISKFILLHSFILFIGLLLTSCHTTGKDNNDVGGCEVVYPKPSTNPAIFSSEVQTKIITVKNIKWIEAENPETDKTEVNNVQSTTTNLWITVENDWIKVKYGDNLPKETVEITIKENTSEKPRSYHLRTRHNIYETILIITQNGKIGN